MIFNSIDVCARVCGRRVHVGSPSVVSLLFLCLLLLGGMLFSPGLNVGVGPVRIAMDTAYLLHHHWLSSVIFSSASFENFGCGTCKYLCICVCPIRFRGRTFDEGYWKCNFAYSEACMMMICLQIHITLRGRRQGESANAKMLREDKTKRVKGTHCSAVYRTSL